MSKKELIDFCTHCRDNTIYTLQKRTIKKKIKNRFFTFDITVAVCDKCGKQMDIRGLLDANNKAINEQYERQLSEKNK